MLLYIFFLLFFEEKEKEEERKEEGRKRGRGGKEGGREGEKGVGGGGVSGRLLKIIVALGKSLYHFCFI